MYALFVFAVIQYNVKAARHGNYELMQCLVGVSTAFCPARHIIKIVYSLNLKRNMNVAFYEGEISSWVLNPR